MPAALDKHVGLSKICRNLVVLMGHAGSDMSNGLDSTLLKGHDAGKHGRGDTVLDQRKLKMGVVC